jgi:Family of unknown function (DUF6157)
VNRFLFVVLFFKLKKVKTMHTTNYFNTFIEIAEDCPTQSAEIPPQKGDSKSVANWQFDKIMHNPYSYTSDEVIFDIHTIRNGIDNNETEKAVFFSKGQPCLRSSPLGKRYGWGIHYNEEGKMALYPAESEEYQRFAADATLKHTKAMRSKKA